MKWMTSLMTASVLMMAVALTGCGGEGSGEADVTTGTSTRPALSEGFEQAHASGSLAEVRELFFGRDDLPEVIREPLVAAMEADLVSASVEPIEPGALAAYEQAMAAVDDGLKPVGELVLTLREADDQTRTLTLPVGSHEGRHYLVPVTRPASPPSLPAD
ncbi:MAG: hypothetical protein R3336_04635 [Phycisphaeraceae bacterium]|nr:hypothetical protein [Phycisphaeraceae bacterium]